MHEYIIFSVEDREGVLHVGLQQTDATNALTRALNQHTFADLYQLQCIGPVTNADARRYVEAYRIKLGLPSRHSIKHLPKLAPDKHKIDLANLPRQKPVRQVHPHRRLVKMATTHAPNNPNGWWDFNLKHITHA